MIINLWRQSDLLHNNMAGPAMRFTCIFATSAAVTMAACAINSAFSNNNQKAYEVYGDSGKRQWNLRMLKDMALDMGKGSKHIKISPEFDGLQCFETLQWSPRH